MVWAASNNELDTGRLKQQLMQDATEAQDRLVAIAGSTEVSGHDRLYTWW